MKFVSKTLVREQILALHSEDDLLLDLYIEAVSEAIFDYLKESADSFVDSEGNVSIDSSDEPIVPSRVRLAALFLIAVYCRNRDENADGIFAKMAELPHPVTALLYPLRRPTLV